MAYAPIAVGELNDGKEAKYPGTDVPSISQLVQILVCQELTDRMDQNPALDAFLTIQGAVGSPSADIGTAIRGSLIKVLGMLWVPMVGPNNFALLVRIQYYGTNISIINFHRPNHEDQVPTFDASMSALAKQERGLGNLTLVVGDANESQPINLAAMLHSQWVAPFDTSVVGLFVPRQIKVIGVDRLPKTGEHSPVVAYLRIPTAVLS